MKQAKKTPSQVTAGIIRAAMSAESMTIDQLAKLAKVCKRTVSADLIDPERIPQGRLWLYFTALGIPIDGALQNTAAAFAQSLAER
jgi:hypothetical protein